MKQRKVVTVVIVQKWCSGKLDAGVRFKIDRANKDETKK